MKKHIPIEVGLYNEEVLIRSLRHVQFFSEQFLIHMYNIMHKTFKKTTTNTLYKNS